MRALTVPFGRGPEVARLGQVLLDERLVESDAQARPAGAGLGATATRMSVIFRSDGLELALTFCGYASKASSAARPGGLRDFESVAGKARRSYRESE